MQNKRFDKELFDKYDKMGRDIVKSYVGQWGMVAEDNPDRYGVDLNLYAEGKLVGLLRLRCETLGRLWSFLTKILMYPTERRSC
jgi:hypothetical protein